MRGPSRPSGALPRQTRQVVACKPLARVRWLLTCHPDASDDLIMRALFYFLRGSALLSVAAIAACGTGQTGDSGSGAHANAGSGGAGFGGAGPGGAGPGGTHSNGSGDNGGSTGALGLPDAGDSGTGGKGHCAAYKSCASAATTAAWRRTAAGTCRTAARARRPTAAPAAASRTSVGSRRARLRRAPRRTSTAAWRRDGCGNVLDCGHLPHRSGVRRAAGATSAARGVCTPKTCADAGLRLRHAGRRLRQPVRLRHLRPRPRSAAAA